MSEQRGRKTKVFNQSVSDHYSRLTATDHLAFVFYCALLCIPAYAIISSAIKQDWLMMVVDLLFVPVGLVHGVLLLFSLLQ